MQNTLAEFNVRLRLCFYYAICFEIKNILENAKNFSKNDP